MSNFISATNGPLQQIYLNQDEFEKLDNFVGNRLWSWGGNYNGELGINSLLHRSTPVQIAGGTNNWTKMIQDGIVTAAIKTDGTLWTWGRGGYGQLGNNSIASNRSSPAQITSGGTNWRQIASASSGITALKTDGTLWAWGDNTQGQLGVGDILRKSSPVQIFGGGTNWRQVGGRAAIKTDGTLWNWGNNTNGQLGANDRLHRSSPTQVVGGGTNWRQVTTGGSTITGAQTSGFVLAVKTDGTLWGWGTNGVGQLGDNTIINRSSPVQIAGGGTNWKSVGSGEGGGAALKTDGTLWTWGLNFTGALGDNTVIHRSSPVQTVSGGNNWKSLAYVQNSRACGGIKTDGTLWLWGSNYQGSLGINVSTGHRSSPVQTIVGGFNWKEAIAGTVSKAGITFMD
jgi:alpha-tubulin suppressor-like RCC1 family protein